MSQLPEAQFPNEPGRPAEPSGADPAAGPPLGPSEAPTTPIPTSAATWPVPPPEGPWPDPAAAPPPADPYYVADRPTPPPRWNAKRTAIVAAAAIGLGSVGAVAAAAATPNGIAAPTDTSGRGGPGGFQRGAQNDGAPVQGVPGQQGMPGQQRQQGPNR